MLGGCVFDVIKEAEDHLITHKYVNTKLYYMNDGSG